MYETVLDVYNIYIYFAPWFWGYFNTLHLPARVENWATRNITVRGNEMLFFLFTEIICNTLHDNNEVTQAVCKKM